MVNKFVYNAQTSALAAVPGAGGARWDVAKWTGRALRVVFVVAALGASVVAMGFAAQSANGATQTAQR